MYSESALDIFLNGGVPQGTALGPLWFSLCADNLVRVAAQRCSTFTSVVKQVDNVCEFCLVEDSENAITEL